MNALKESLYHERVGVLLALCTLLFGFGLGGTFGVAEENLKNHLSTQANEVMETAYGGDTQAADKVVAKSWTYFKRAHLHANGLGTSALVLMVLLACTQVGARLKRGLAMALGLGALGYSAYWLFAGLRAPGLGSTGAAKASLEWLAIPTAGLCLVGLLAVTIVVVQELFRKPA